jgi:two-component system, chemotaxis family, chemotaxis protein CheY
MPTLPNKRVLIVDDSSSTRLILNKIISAQGFECTEAATGDEAIKAYNTDRPALVMLDIHIDNLSGMGVLQVIRSIDPDARVIVVSNESDKNIIDKMISLGARAFVPKPFEPEILKDAISRAFD